MKAKLFPKPRLITLFEYKACIKYYTFLASLNGVQVNDRVHWLRKQFYLQSFSAPSLLPHNVSPYFFRSHMFLPVWTLHWASPFTVGGWEARKSLYLGGGGGGGGGAAVQDRKHGACLEQ